MALIPPHLLIVCCSALAVSATFLWHYWLRPKLRRNAFLKQGLSGPSPHLFVGTLLEMAKIRKQLIRVDMGSNNHDIGSQLLPEYYFWSKIYGKTFVHWMGVEPVLYSTEPELLKELGTFKNGTSRPPFLRRDRKPLLGNGLIAASGKEWHYQRRLVGPAFNLEKIKGMAKTMESCTKRMLANVDKEIRDPAGWTELEVHRYLTSTTGDIIAQTAFGTSFDAGKLVFEKLTRLLCLIFKPGRLVGIPGARYFPTALGREIRRLESEADGLLRQAVQERILISKKMPEQTGKYGNDLLGLMLEESEAASKDDPTHKFDHQILIDQCKTFYFAGHETVSNTITWTLLLLAENPDWQEKAREEVIQWSKGGSCFDPEALSNMKTVQMILNESLRLYPAVAYLVRWVDKEIQLEKFRVPKEMTVWIPIVALHHDPEVWGKDANEFRPERFMNGVPKDCKQSFLPFGLGVRTCVGQNFAAMEMRVLLAMILCRFRFRVSPTYKHAPLNVLTVRPMNGVHLLVGRVSNPKA